MTVIMIMTHAMIVIMTMTKKDMEEHGEEREIGIDLISSYECRKMYSHVGSPLLTFNPICTIIYSYKYRLKPATRLPCDDSFPVYQ